MLEEICYTKVKVNSIKKVYVEQFLNTLKTKPSLIDNIQQISLFGSVLTDRCTEASDIDICIISEKANDMDFQVEFSMFMLELYKNGFDTECDRIIINKEDYNNNIKNSDIMYDIHTNSKTVYSI